jgi:hypothetical protein
VNCSRARATLSERMDGERLSARQAAVLEDHVGSCLTCQAFRARADRLRQSVRIRPAEQIPDLAERIMGAIEAEAAPSVRRFRRRPASLRSRSRGRWTPVAAALLVGLVAGSVAVGGPWGRPSSNGVTADFVVKGVRVAARRLDAYHASFKITERGLPGIPTRTFSMEVAFATPGRYRLEVADDTQYPDARTPTDLTFIANGTAMYRRGPLPCPTVIDPSVCLPAREPVTVSSAYATQASLATNLVVPVDVLGNPRRLTVTDTGTVLGRSAVRVELPFDRAAPLFAFREVGGTWRPVFPDDRVVLWVDDANWFPLRATVYPSTDPGRREWAQLFGLPAEDPSQPIIDLVATSIGTAAPPQSDFVIPGGVVQPEVPQSDLRREVGFAPLKPGYLANLTPAYAVVPPIDAGPSAPDALLTYASGVSYLRVGERQEPHAGIPLGSADAAAEVIHLTNGVAYYQPAEDGHGRRLTIHAGDRDLVLETNLPRDELLKIAATFPVTGEQLPRAWLTEKAGGDVTEVVTLAQARRRTPFPVKLPATLPQGYVVARVLLTRIGGITGVTITFQSASDLEGEPIELHVEPANRLPFAAADAMKVPVGDAGGRWSAEDSQLEWLQGGRYLSLRAPGLGLTTIMAMALTIPEVPV